MMLPTTIDTVIIGAGQSGLSMSYYLTKAKRNHIMLERNRIAESWHKRWDSFKLVTPNWTLCLPGYPYTGSNPHGFSTHKEIVKYLTDYADFIKAPIYKNITVLSVKENRKGPIRYEISTNHGILHTDNIIIATGFYQKPSIPLMAKNFPADISQLHSSQYLNSSNLNFGNVLLVGSGQSGWHIAKELCEQKWKIFFSLGTTPCVPRQYRGKDIYWWLQVMGMTNKAVEELPSLEARFKSNPYINAEEGTENDLHLLYKKGAVFLGRLSCVNEKIALFEEDAQKRLVDAKNFSDQARCNIDNFITKKGFSVPDEKATLLDAVAAISIPSYSYLDLVQHNVTNIIWCTGYRPDFSWIKLPIFDDKGYPLQVRGITDSAGIYFLGLPWLHKAKSSLLLGVGEDAAYIADFIATH